MGDRVSPARRRTHDSSRTDQGRRRRRPLCDSVLRLRVLVTTMLRIYDDDADVPVEQTPGLAAGPPASAPGRGPAAAPDEGAPNRESGAVDEAAVARSQPANAVHAPTAPGYVGVA